jgi:hypothetical protein
MEAMVVLVVVLVVDSITLRQAQELALADKVTVEETALVQPTLLQLLAAAVAVQVR